MTDFLFFVYYRGREVRKGKGGGGWMGERGG